MTDGPLTLADQADISLRRDIVGGVLKPGQKLTAAALIRRYNMGASPLREALSRLSADRLVVLQGKRGFSVAPVSVGELDDISRCRRLVEMEAVRLSVSAGDESWQAGVVAAFHRLDRAEERAMDGAPADPEQWEARNRTFHTAVIAACGSEWLQHLQQLLYAQHERYRRVSLRNRDPARDVRAEHRAIMQACLAGEAGEAARLSGEHIDRTAAAVRAVLADLGVPAMQRRRGVRP